MLMALAIAVLGVGILTIYEAHNDPGPLAGLGLLGGILCTLSGIGGILVAIFV